MANPAKRKADSNMAPKGGRGKRVKAAPKVEEPQYFSEKRNLEDLWQTAFPVGTEWENIDKLKDINWNFSNLEDALEEGGELYGKKVYTFLSTEAQQGLNGGVMLVPVMVAVVSPVPPSDKIGIKSVMRENEEIIPMKSMKMEWVPYIPLEYRQKSRLGRLKTQIYTLACTQRRSALKLLKEERVRQYDYCLPYLQPLKADEDEENTVVDIIFPMEPQPPVQCEFDWELDDLEEFTVELIEGEALPEDQKDAFKEFVKEQVRKTRKKQKLAREARRKALEDMNSETKAAFENMRILKFYPVSTPDTPNILQKTSYINRYYGKAHVVM